MFRTYSVVIVINVDSYPSEYLSLKGYKRVNYTTRLRILLGIIKYGNILRKRNSQLSYILKEMTNLHQFHFPKTSALVSRITHLKFS